MSDDELPMDTSVTMMLARSGLLLSTIWQCVEQIDAGPAFAAFREDLRLEAIEALETSAYGLHLLVRYLPEEVQGGPDKQWAEDMSRELEVALKQVKDGPQPDEPSIPTPAWALEVLQAMAKREDDGGGA